MIRRSASSSVALVAALALAVTASGGAGAVSTTPTDTTEVPGTAASPAGEPVKIMVMYEATGVVVTPEVPEGAIAAAELINASGGIGGSPIELIECDLANDPNQARACGEQAVSEAVVAVVGPVSANAGEYLPLLEAAEIPLVGNVPAAATDFTSPASYPLYGGIVSAAAGLADVLASDAGSTTISLARIDLAAAAVIGVFANQSLARNELAVNNDVAIPPGAPDMATYVESALEGGTDGVLVGLTGQDATNFIIQLRQTAPDVPIAATTTEFTAVLEALGDAANGIYVTDFFHDETTDPEAYAEFSSAMEAAGFDELGGFRRNSFTAVQVVAAVLGELPELTGPALYAALPTVEGLEVPLLPPLQFTVPKVEMAPRIFNVCGIYQQLDGAEFTTLTDGFIDTFTGEPC